MNNFELGSIFKITDSVLEITNSDPNIDWDPTTEILLLLEENNSLRLNPREVAGKRLYIKGDSKSLRLLFNDKYINKIINDAARTHKCNLIQVSSTDFDLRNHLGNDFIHTCYILKKDLTLESSTEQANDVKRIKIPNEQIEKIARNEYFTRIKLPGGTHPKDDTLEKVINEYKEMQLDQEQDLFHVYSYKDYGTLVYFIWLVDQDSKMAIRCFSWVDESLRGRKISYYANKEIFQILKNEYKIESCLSFTTIQNIGQVKNSLKAGYKINELVYIQEVQ